MNFTLEPFHKSRDSQVPNHYGRVTTTASSVTIIISWLTSFSTWPARGVTVFPSISCCWRFHLRMAYRLRCTWADSPHDERAIDYVFLVLNAPPKMTPTWLLITAKTLRPRTQLYKSAVRSEFICGVWRRHFRIPILLVLTLAGFVDASPASERNGTSFCCI